MSDYCYYSDIGNIFQVFKSHKQHHHSKSKNIRHRKICTWFQLSIGFSKDYYHYSREPGFTDQFIQIGPKWARQLSLYPKTPVLFLAHFPSYVTNSYPLLQPQSWPKFLFSIFRLCLLFFSFFIFYFLYYPLLHFIPLPVHRVVCLNTLSAVRTAAARLSTA